MKPSNYNYIKRMWSRYLIKQGPNIKHIVGIPLRILVLILLSPFIVFFWPFKSIWKLFINSPLPQILTRVILKVLFIVMAAAITLYFLVNLFDWFGYGLVITVIFTSLLLLFFIFRRKRKQDPAFISDEKCITFDSNIESTDALDLNEYARMCNSYIEHQEEMERYRK